MSEWPGKLSRIDAITIIERITDQDDPAWEWAVEDWYDEYTDTMPSIYEVLATLGVTEDEYKEATGAQNTNWPNFADEQHVAALNRIDDLENKLQRILGTQEDDSIATPEDALAKIYLICREADHE